MLVLVAAVGPAWADEVVFMNGDRLTGKLVVMTNGKLSFTSDLFGKLDFDFDLVQTFSTAEPVEIHLFDGTVLKDQVLAASLASQADPEEPEAPTGIEEAGAPEAASEEPLTVEEPGVADLVVPDVQQQGAPAEQEVPEQIPDDLVALESRRYSTTGASSVGPQTFRLDDTIALNPPEVDPIDWSGRAFGGFEIDRGNSHTHSAEIDTRIVRRTELTRFTVTADYDADRQRDNSTGTRSTSKNQLRGTAQHDYFLTKKHYVFGLTSAENDRVADLDLRFVVASGWGYQWVETDDFNFNTELGLTWTDERYEDDTEDDDFITGLLKWNLERRLRKNVSFFQHGNWRPSLEESRTHIIETQTGFRSDITGTLFLEARVDWDWDSKPAPGANRQDVEYVFGLGYRFD